MILKFNAFMGYLVYNTTPTYITVIRDEYIYGGAE